MYTLRRRSALFAFLFSFVCGGRDLRSDWLVSPIAGGAEVAHPVVELLTFTSHVHEVTSLVSALTTLVHLATSMYNKLATLYLWICIIPVKIEVKFQ